MKSLKSGLVVSLAVLLSAACTSTETTNTNANRTNPSLIATGPANANNANNSNAAGSMTATASADGAGLYQTSGCVACHAPDGKGNAAMKSTMKDLPDFTNAAWQKKATDAEMIDTITNGHKPMPAYKDKLTEDQIKAIVAYVRKFAS